MQVNLILLERELVRALRGRYTQTRFSNLLGYSFNQVARWESGKRRLSWPDFVKICQKRSVEIGKHTKEFISSSSDPLDVRAILARLQGSRTDPAFAKACNISVHAIRRWRSGKTLPNVADILSMIHQESSLLLSYLDSFTDAQNLPSLRLWLDREKTFRSLIFQHPYMLAFMCTLDLDIATNGKKYTPGILGAKIGISKKEEEICVAKLIDAGILKIVNGRLQTTQIEIDIRSDFEGKNTLRKYWQEQSVHYLKRLTTNTVRSCFGYSTYSTSEATRLKIRDRYYQFHRDVELLLKQDRGKKACVQVMNISILDFDELTKL